MKEEKKINLDICSNDTIALIVKELEIDFDRGMSHYLELFSSKTKENPMLIINTFNKYRKRVFHAFKDNHARLNSKNIDIIFASPEIFLYSLFNRYRSTLKATKNLHGYKNLNGLENVFIKNEKVRNKYIKILTAMEYKMNEKECLYFLGSLPFEISLKNSRFLTYTLDKENYLNGSKEYKEKVINLEYKKLFHKLPCAIPQWILESDEYLEICSSNIQERELIKNIVSRVGYNKKEENLLLRYLGIVEDDYNIEKYLQEMISSNKELKISDLPLMDLLAINVFIKKIFYKNGVDDIKVNLFDYDYTDMNIKASFDSEERIIRIFFHHGDLNIREKIQAIMHEFFHVIQDKDIKELNLINNENILDYSKDIFLRLILGEDYYLNNYYSISYEYDAEMKSLLVTNDVCGELDEILYKYDCNNEKELLENQKYLKDLEEEIVYFDTKKRFYKGDFYNLDDLFLEKVNKSINEFGCFNIKELIRENCECLFLDYKFDGERIVRKSMEDLLKDMSENDEKRELYLKLVELRLKENKEMKINR